MLDKKQIWAISLWNFLSSKCIVKQWRQLTASATHLALELLTNVQCSGGSRSFAKEIIALKIKNAVAGHWKLTTTSLRAVTKANPLTTTQKVAKELKVNHAMIIWHLKQAGKVKKLVKWVPYEMTANQKKKKDLKCCLLLFYETMSNFSTGLWHVTKSAFYTASNNQLSGWMEKMLQSTSQSQTRTKKGHGHCLVVCCWCDPLQLSESWLNHYTWSMLNKSKRSTENCNPCSWHWST